MGGSSARGARAVDVPPAGLAEDIGHETWLAVLRELDTFQGRSSLKIFVPSGFILGVVR